MIQGKEKLKAILKNCRATDAWLSTGILFKWQSALVVLAGE
jgi:hypothetical protein